MTLLTAGPACDWQWDRQIVRNAGTSVGGPTQTGPSRQVRFCSDTAPCSLIDLILYVTRDSGGYRLNLLAVWSVFDPAVMEITWSGSRTWAGRSHGGDLIFAGIEMTSDAHEMTSGHDGLATVLGTFGGDVFTAVLGWDGEPFDAEGEQR